MTSPPAAAIDVGSNTTRLIAASFRGNSIQRNLVCQKATRLGQELFSSGKLSENAMNRTLDAIHIYKQTITEMNIDQVLIGATSAVREASNGPEFMARIKEQTGYETRILTEFQEAELAAAGVCTVIPNAESKVLIIDVGGRSSEFILMDKGRPAFAKSLKLGAVGLTEAYITSDPPQEPQIKEIREKIKSAFDAALTELAESAQGVPVIGTAGTITTLAAMAQELTNYQPEKINNFILERSYLSSVTERLITSSIKQKENIPGLPEDRADIIAAGALIFLEIINFFNIRQLIVSDAGLLEGLWLVAAGKRRIE